MSKRVINVVVKGNNVEYLKCTSDFDKNSYASFASLATLCKMEAWVNGGYGIEILPSLLKTSSATPNFYAFAIMPDMPIVYQGNTTTIRDLIGLKGESEIYNTLPRITEEEFYSDTLD